MLVLSTSFAPSQYYNVYKKISKVDNKKQVCLIFGQIDLEHFFGGEIDYS